MIPEKLNSFLDELAKELTALRSSSREFDDTFKLAVRNACGKMTKDELAVVLVYILSDFSRAEQDMSWEMEKHAGKDQKTGSRGGDPNSSPTG